MIFNELYSAYYNTVAAILSQAVQHPVTKEELRKIIDEKAFSESILSIEPSLTGGKWQLLKTDGSTPIEHAPVIPLTILQKRWLKAISLDPRMKLFEFDVSGLGDVSPLFTQEDIYIFDRYADGDDFENETYIYNFHVILDAVKKQYPLSIDIKSPGGRVTHLNGMPEYLEYSEKDDKFRLITSGYRRRDVVNLGRIVSCKPFHGNNLWYRKSIPDKNKTIVIELYDERNALERVMLHFAHFEKSAQRLDEKHYRISISYQKSDETEMVIRVLSFGPFIKVIEPESFVNLIKERLKMQKGCELI